MTKSKAKEVTPHGTVHLVKWVRTRTTRGVKGRWLPDKPKNPAKSAQSSPTKSPSKQPSDRMMYRFSENFDGSYNDQGAINRIYLPNGLGKKKTAASPPPELVGYPADLLEQSPNEYLRQWKYRTQDYLDIMLQREAPPPDRVCSLCGGDV